MTVSSTIQLNQRLHLGAYPVFLILVIKNCSLQRLNRFCTAFLLDPVHCSQTRYHVKPFWVTKQTKIIDGADRECKMDISTPPYLTDLEIYSRIFWQYRSGRFHGKNYYTPFKRKPERFLLIVGFVLFFAVDCTLFFEMIAKKILSL